MHLALLRGINVGGKNVIRMNDLKRIFEDMGLIWQSQLVDATNRLNTSDAFIPAQRLSRTRLLSWRATAFNSARV